MKFGKLFRKPAEKRQLSVDAKLMEIARENTGRATPESVLSIAAAYAAIYAISTDTAILPLKVYQKTARERREATEHPAHDLMNFTPDGETTAVRFRQALMGHAVSRGNGYAEIRRDMDGQPRVLHLMSPAVTPCREENTGRLFYDLGNENTLPPSRVLHVAGLGADGLKGYSPLTLARRAFELAIETERYGVSFYRNGSRPGGVITYPGEVTPKMRENLVASWERLHQGGDNAHKVAVLEEGSAYHAVTIPPEEAQFLQTRQMQVVEIARIFRVPPHKIADYSQMQLASAGVEAANIDYVTTTLMAWCTQLEAECNLKLLTPMERAAGYYFKHSLNALLRGDMKTRAEFYGKLFSFGALSPNEIRELEDMNPIEGGDKHFTPLNMGGLEDPKEEPAKVAPEEPEKKSRPIGFRTFNPWDAVKRAHD